MRVVVYGALDELPVEYDRLFQAGAARSFFLSRAWFENLAATAMDSGDRLQLIGVEQQSQSLQPKALLVARTTSGAAGDRALRRMANFTTLYTTEFDLLIDPDRTGIADIADAIARFVRDMRPRLPLFEIKALALEGRSFDAFSTVLRQRGYATAAYQQFGSWYAQTEDHAYETFAKTLPKGLRQLRKKLDRPDGPHFELVTGGAELDRAIGIYEQLYVESWKEAEPYPRFVPGLARAAAREGALRFGLLYVDGQPAAAQIWIVSAKRATIFKVVHSESYKRLSPGSVLTTRMLEHVIDVDRVHEVDFGRGDDAYKRMWLPRRREFWAILAYDPLTIGGALGALRDVVLVPIVRRARHAALRIARRDAAGGEDSAHHGG